MHHMTLKAAVKKYGELYDQGATWEELSAEMIKAGHTEDEAKKVMDTILNGGEGDEAGGNKGDEGDKQPTTAAANQTNAGDNSEDRGPVSPYSQYDLWRVEIQRMERKIPGTNDVQVIVSAYEAIKRLRASVKIEPGVADDINAQSHNSAMRYYPAGTVTPGDVEKVDLSTY